MTKYNNQVCSIVILFQSQRELLGKILNTITKPAELKGFFHGLKPARRMGFRKVCLESDGTDALALVEHGCSFQHEQFSLAMEITELLPRLGSCFFSHMQRSEQSGGLAS